MQQTRPQMKTAYEVFMLHKKPHTDRKGGGNQPYGSSIQDCLPGCVTTRITRYLLRLGQLKKKKIKERNIFQL